MTAKLTKTIHPAHRAPVLRLCTCCVTLPTIANGREDSPCDVGQSGGGVPCSLERGQPITGPYFDGSSLAQMALADGSACGFTTKLFFYDTRGEGEGVVSQVTDAPNYATEQHVVCLVTHFGGVTIIITGIPASGQHKEDFSTVAYPKAGINVTIITSK